MTNDLILNCNPIQLKAFEQIEFELFTKLDDICGNKTNILIKKLVQDEPRCNFLCKLKDLIMRYPEDYIKNKVNKLESDLFYIMNDDGTINGNKLNIKLSQNKKAHYITPVLAIPHNNFDLAEFIKHYPGDFSEIKGYLDGII